MSRSDSSSRATRPVRTRKYRALPSLLPETDCEDQGFSRISDGCLLFKCQTWRRDKLVRTNLVKVERYGKLWWTCPKCQGSYGEVS